MSDFEPDVSVDQLVAAINQKEPINARQPSITYSREAGSVVYFITCRNMVKVGYSVGLERRAQGFQQVIPFQIAVLGVLLCGRDEEARIHRALIQRHHHNEWFHMNDELERILAFETASFAFRNYHSIEHSSRKRRGEARTLARMQFDTTLSPNTDNVVHLKNG